MLSEPFSMQDGKWTRQDEEASLARGTSKSSPQCIVVPASKCFKMPEEYIRMHLFVLCILYPCSAAEGQIAMAIFCHTGGIFVEPLIASRFPLLVINLLHMFSCCERLH